MNELLKTIDVLYANDKHEELYLLVEEQLRQNSNDIELWIGLAVAIIAVPIVDYEKSIACLEKALAIDYNNPIALLILAYVYEFNLAGIDDILLHQIKNLDAGSNELNSLLKYVASWSYAWNKKNNPEMEEELLKESIELCNKYVWNYKHLVRLYSDQKRYSEINPLIYKALSNIKKVYSDEDDYDVTDIDEFINQHIKGIHTTRSSIRFFKKDIISKRFLLWHLISTPFYKLYHGIKQLF